MSKIVLKCTSFMRTSYFGYLNQEKTCCVYDKIKAQIIHAKQWQGCHISGKVTALLKFCQGQGIVMEVWQSVLGNFDFFLENFRQLSGNFESTRIILLSQQSIIHQHVCSSPEPKAQKDYAPASVHRPASVINFKNLLL